MSKLIVVPTPIGNLSDATFRSINALKEVDFIIAEDTRKSGILFKQYGIQKKVYSNYIQNEHKRLPEIIRQLKNGKSGALISDAGMPGISDPGYLLIRECIQEGIEIECLPGPSAFLPALVLSGIPIDRFIFEGFIPAKKGRQKRLESLKDEKRTMVFYESPHRVVKTLEQFSELFGPERQCSVSRELTKIYEETIRGSLGEVVEIFSTKNIKGEFVIVVAGAS
ncbi:MAG: 16S rRNA (cytidine(1402)-2'-O)-methyltransferase [Bacteroidetes bacterium]|nr:16S rRNA (cytidine(1402)-2'-O)-methyltransferase [Bacteroidota bacterium]